MITENREKRIEDTKAKKIWENKQQVIRRNSERLNESFQRIRRNYKERVCKTSLSSDIADTKLQKVNLKESKSNVEQ